MLNPYMVVNCWIIYVQGEHYKVGDKIVNLTEEVINKRDKLWILPTEMKNG